jgi:hypothetical protein
MTRRDPFRRANRTRLQLLLLEDRATPSGSRVPPTANDDVADTDGNNPVAVAVLGNDSAAEGSTLVPSSVSVVSNPSRGTVSVNSTTGEITYTATGFFTGSDRFQYTVKDDSGLTSTAATVTIIVNRPVANDDFTETTVGTPVKIDVLANDSDPDGNDQIDPTSVKVTVGPAHGTTAVDPVSGQVTYTPTAGFTGTDTFQYTITDKPGAVSPPGHVTVVVNPPVVVPPSPTSNDDAADTDGNAPVTVDVLANDTAPSGQTLQPGTVTISTAPARGTVSVDPTTGQVTYTASGFFMGTDTFRYTVKDSAGTTSNPATVTIVVNRPTANADFADTDGTNPVTVDVLANDTDPDGNDKIEKGSVTIFTQPAHGTVSVNPTTGEATYTAAPGFRGTDTFTYTIADDAGAVSVPATVTIVVNRPTANDDFAATAFNSPVKIDLLANDTDPDGNDEINATTVKVVASPAHGTVSIDPVTGAATYTPAAGFAGTDTFTYTVSDKPGAESNVATVTVRVNEAPLTVAGADAGGGPQVTVFNADGSVRATFFAFPANFTGGVRVAVGDVNGDGVSDIVAATGAGGGPAVAVFSGKDLSLLKSFYAYDPSFAGGVFVAVGDVDGDGFADIITGPGTGGGPQVNVFSGKTGQLLKSAFAYDPSFRDGVTVAAGDVDGDGKADILTGTGAGGGPAVTVFRGTDLKQLASFYALPSNFVGGLFVASADVNGDGIADVIVGPGTGGGPQVTVFNGKDFSLLESFYAYDPSFTGGVRVGAVDANSDGRAEVVAAPGPGAALPTLTIDATTLQPVTTGSAFGDFRGGVFIGGNG